MLYENDRQYKLAAPDVDELLRLFDDVFPRNSFGTTPEIDAAMDRIFELLAPLAPLRKNSNVKALWLRIPRGTIEDYASFPEMKEYGEVETYEEFEALWRMEYPEETVWYELVVMESHDPDGVLSYRSISLGNRTVFAARLDRDRKRESNDNEETVVKLCSLILPAIGESMARLRAGTYNEMVRSSLPYWFRTGVIKRSNLWKYDPEEKKQAYDGLSKDAVRKLKELIEAGANDIDRIGRLREFTANDFFRACRLGYESIGEDCDGFTLPELYMHYSDGRDEGLTGYGHGLNAGPGIEFDSPAARDEWFFNRTQHGGHPWEVVPGGSSTHVELYVWHDKRDLEWDFSAGEITRDEYEKRIASAGYYFLIAGMHRPFEAVSFYLALSAAGLPVFLSDADAMLARFDGSDLVGIVPHHIFPRYCEDWFPESYGEIIDFMHVYDEEMALYGEAIQWLPPEEAEWREPQDR